jgi:hypothetical protein
MGQVDGGHFLDDGGDQTSLEVDYSLAGLGQTLEINLCFSYKNLLFASIGNFYIQPCRAGCIISVMKKFKRF